MKTPFDEAVNRLRDHLETSGRSGEIVWLFSEDILTVVRDGKVRYFMARGNREKNESIARLYYEIGRRKELGIALHGFASYKNKTACCITIPEDDLDAQYRFILSDSLKYSCVIDMKEIEITYNPLKQWWLGILSLMNPAGQRTRWTCRRNTCSFLPID